MLKIEIGKICSKRPHDRASTNEGGIVVDDQMLVVPALSRGSS
jgi:hypothetical protein